MYFPDAGICTNYVEQYLAALSASSEKTVTIIRVSDINADKPYIIFHTDDFLSSLDYIKVCLDDQPLNTNDYELIAWDYDEHTLTLKPAPAKYHFFATVEPNRITLVSSLLFLTERLHDWYQENESHISYPSRLPHKIPIQSLPFSLTAEQQDAINTIFNHPVSYIWGIPGSGKTKAVLATCVLSYLRAGLPILLSAPTNIAVDQMLRGILPYLSETDIPLYYVHRLGTPTYSFALEWPQVCKNPISTGLDKQIGILQGQLQKIENQLDLDERLSHYSTLCLYADIIASQISVMIENRSIAYAELEKKNILLSNLSTALQQNNARKDQKRKMLADLEAKRKKFFFRLSNAFRTAASQQIDDSIALHRLQISECENTEEKLLSDQQRIESQKNTLRSEIERITHEIKAVSIDFFSLFPRQISACLLSYQENNAYDHILALRDFFRANADSSFLEQSTKIKLLERHRKTRIRLQRLQSEFERINSTSDSPDNALLYAGTIDTIINNDQIAKTHFHHIFLDEAGYTSIIKSLPFLAWKCPFTLLGDHKQLPPVCEFEPKKNDADSYYLVPFKQSAIYLDDFFDSDLSLFAEQYFSGSSPHFKNMTCSILSRTHRYGESLANVLSDKIYHFPIISAAKHETQIMYVDVKGNIVNNQNIPESLAIAQWCKEHPDVTPGILCPYKNQRKALKAALRNTRASRNIMTVHKSQGQEWDTILLSVVDGTSKTWFMNTNIKSSPAPYLINTAISRSRNVIILFCDVSFWRMHPSQMIASLLKIAKPAS